MILSVFKAHSHLFKGGLENFLQQVERTIQHAEDLATAGILTQDRSPKTGAGTVYRYTWHCRFSSLDPETWRSYRRTARVSTTLSCDMRGKVPVSVYPTNPVLGKLIHRNSDNLLPSERSRAKESLIVLRAFRPGLYTRLAILCYRKNPKSFQLFQEIEDTSVNPVENIDSLEQILEILEHLLLLDHNQPQLITLQS